MIPPTRRDFLGSTAAVCSAALLPPILRAVTEDASAAAPAMVVADGRYSESRSFAEEFARGRRTRWRGEVGAILSREMDLSRLWSEALEPRLAAGRFTVAGLTLGSDLFVLQQLARRSGVVIAYSGTHDWRGTPLPSRHRLCGTIALDRIADSLAPGERPWPQRLASALATSNLGTGSARQERHVSADLSHAPDSPRYLVSWLMLSHQPAFA